MANNLKIENLLNELEESKRNIRMQMNEIEEQKKYLEKLFPEKLDFKSRYMLIEKVDIFTRFYELILKYDKQLADIIKDQIQLIIKNRDSLEGKEQQVSSIALNLANVILNKEKNEDNSESEITYDIDDIIGQDDEDFKKLYENNKYKLEESKSSIISEPSSLDESTRSINKILEKIDIEKERREEAKRLEDEIRELEQKQKEKNTDKNMNEKILDEIDIINEEIDSLKKSNIFLDSI